jgi:FKBP-type peptidyl-prolyl cis-trans isomerase
MAAFGLSPQDARLGVMMLRLFRLGAAIAFASAFALAACSKPASNSSAAPSDTAKQSDKASSSTANDGAAKETETGEGPTLNDSLDGTPATMNEDAFLSAYRDLDGVKTLPDGVMYRVLKAGSGKSPKASDKVSVRYKGTLMDGSVFDETKEDETAEFPVDGLIKGWQEILQLMKEGDKWEAVIPSDLAYGDKQTGPIPPNSPLVFEIELVKVL